MEEPLSFDGEDDQARARRRIESRDSMFLRGSIRTIGSEDAATLRVRNLSAGGLMAECTHPFERGEAVELELRGIGLVSGRIAWATEGRIGVAFEWKVDPRLARKPVTVRTEPRLTIGAVRRPGLRID